MIRVDVSKGIQVGGFRYKVDSSQEAHNECVAHNRYGSCASTRELIQIDPSFSETRRSETFIHEVIEAVKEHWSVNLKHDDVVRLTEGIHQVMEGLGVRFVVSSSKKPKGG